MGRSHVPGPFSGEAAFSPFVGLSTDSGFPDREGACLCRRASESTAAPAKITFIRKNFASLLPGSRRRSFRRFGRWRKKTVSTDMRTAFRSFGIPVCGRCGGSRVGRASCLECFGEIRRLFFRRKREETPLACAFRCGRPLCSLRQAVGLRSSGRKSGCPGRSECGERGARPGPAIRRFRRTTVASMSGRFEIGVRCPVVSARGGAADSGPSVVGQDESSDLCRNIGLGNGRRRFPAVPLAVGRPSPFFVRFRVPSVGEGRIAFRHSRGALVSVRIPCPHSLCPGASEGTKRSGSEWRNRSFSVAYAYNTVVQPCVSASSPYWMARSLL